MNRRWQRSSGPASPSSRRAWIEIDCGLCAATRGQVALLAEGVDRNESEMAKVKRPGVALLAEGVDRNRLRFVRCYSWAGRPPRGGRG